MPMTFDFTLRTTRHHAPFNGRDVQGAIYAILDAIHPELASALHALEGQRPWSIHAERLGDDGARLRLSVLFDELAGLIEARLLGHGTLPVVKLGPELWAIERISAGMGTDRVPTPSLGRRLLDTPEVVLHLRAPTLFRDGGDGLPDVDRLTPSPERVLQSLQARARHLGLALPGPDLDAPWTLVSELGCTLRTETVRLHFGQRPKTFRGVTGSLHWRLLGDLPDRERLCALVELAHFAGLGSRTGMGLGAVDVNAPPPTPRRDDHDDPQHHRAAPRRRRHPHTNPQP